ncbi:MAG: DUF357 domain-containing protein [Candidatus Hadarchaeales archaeon]
MSVESELTCEIEKWSRKLEEALRRVRSSDRTGDQMLENIRAYHDDSRHFLKNRSLVKSFECLVWAWAILETGKNLGHLEMTKGD